MRQAKGRWSKEDSLGQTVKDSVEFSDVKSVVHHCKLRSPVMAPEDLHDENDLKGVLRKHKGKSPSKSSVANWIKTKGLDGAVSGTNESIIERRVKAQYLLEKHKLMDCKSLLQAKLGLTPSLNKIADEEKALYKEIYLNDMLESQELSKPLKTIEENIENESPNEKTRPSGQEHFGFSKKSTLFESPEKAERSSIAINELAGQNQGCEVIKVERVLFRADSQMTNQSPKSMDDLAFCDDNQSSFVTKTERPFKQENTPIPKVDGPQEIADAIDKLEFLVKNEIDICEERTQMVELLDSFKRLLKNYQDNSKLELLRSQMKAQDQRREQCISIERPPKDQYVEVGFDKLVSGIKRIRMETPETFKLVHDPGNELYRKREPLQHLPTNFSPYLPISYAPQTIHRTIITSQKPRPEPPQSIDLNVLKKHNFSVDLISAFH